MSEKVNDAIDGLNIVLTSDFIERSGILKAITEEVERLEQELADRQTVIERMANTILTEGHFWRCKYCSTEYNDICGKARQSCINGIIDHFKKVSE